MFFFNLCVFQENQCFISVNILGCGAGSGAVTEELNNGVSLYTSKPKNIAVHTVNGTRESNYNRRKIKIKK